MTPLEALSPHPHPWSGLLARDDLRWVDGVLHLVHDDLTPEMARTADIGLVADALAEKMVRRHPHVFGDAVATTPEEVLVHWNAAKAAEKRDRRSVLDGVSAHMPSLALAQKVLGRAAALPDAPSAPLADGVAPSSEEELGATLLGLVALARERGWDAERALRGAVRTLEGGIRQVEARGAGADLEE